MCGFVALLGLHAAPDSRRLHDLLATITHRGPDDHGIEARGRVALGFRRLAIIDLSASGHQPMSSSDGAHSIVFNGEIYNHVELREELERLGHSFFSRSDTEVLLAAYREWGAGCLERLRGMWAFVVHDRRRHLLFGARDRFGMKPLFVHRTAHEIALTSEIKALGLPAETPVDSATCAQYLLSGSLDTSRATFFAGVEQVPPAHAFEIDMQGRWREWRYWDIPSTPAPRISEEDAARRYEALFEESMRLHMRSDVPVGVNLSGGLDSTAVLCSAARIHAATGATSPLLAFSYLDPSFDERRYIESVLAQTGAQLVAVDAAPRQLWDTLPEVLDRHDEPFHSMTPVVGYHLAKEAAARGVKVVLVGQGADEVAGGYGSYFLDRWSELVLVGDVRAAWHEIQAYSQAHGGSARQRMRMAVERGLRTRFRALPLYASAQERAHAARMQRQSWVRPHVRALAAGIQRPPSTGSLDAALRDSVTVAPLPLYLRIEDRNAMAHSVEGRLPFLDHRLVEFTFSLPSSMKCRGPWNKYVLRESLRGRIPENVRARIDKMGFPSDMSGWLRGPLLEPVRDMLDSRAMREHDLLDASALHADLEEHIAGRADHWSRLFRALQLVLWEASWARRRANAIALGRDHAPIHSASV